MNIERTFFGVLAATLVLGSACGSSDSTPGAAGGGGGGGGTVKADAGVDAAAMTGADSARTVDGGPDVVAAMCPKFVESDCDPIREMMLTPDPTRKVYCALDVGSKNIKVSVSSVVPGVRASFDGERYCSASKNLGTKTIDAVSGMGMPLPEKDMDELADFLKKDFFEICKKDNGTMLGAVATEWARKATNQDQIKTWFKAKLDLDLRIATGDEEGRFGYLAATKGAANRIIVDHGSQSFQLSFQQAGDAPPPKVAKISIGSARAGDLFFANRMYPGYAEARAAYVAELKKLLADPTVAPVVALLKEHVKSGKLEKDLISLGDSGVILAVQGKLVDAKGQWVDPMGYRQKLAERSMMAMAMPGGKLLMLADVKRFLDQLAGDKASFEQLRGECIRAEYGNKVMAHLALVSFLSEEMGLSDRVTFSSGEMIEGYVIDKLFPPN